MYKNWLWRSSLEAVRWFSSWFECKYLQVELSFYSRILPL